MAIAIEDAIMNYFKSLCLVVALMLMPGCGSGGHANDVEPILRVADFSPHVTHPYFPVEPGMVRTYQGTYEGKTREEVVRTLEDRRFISEVECTAVHQEVFVDGVRFEITTEWYAQDNAGNVWKFGEESWEFVDGDILQSDDSWLADDEGASPWRAFVAHPHVGQVLVGYSPEGNDVFEVSSLDALALVPAGDFSACLEIVENADDPEDSDIILYARGVGRVSEVNSHGVVELVDVRFE